MLPILWLILLKMIYNPGVLLALSMACLVGESGLVAQPTLPTGSAALTFVSKDLDGDEVADVALLSSRTSWQEMIFIPPNPPFSPGGLTMIMIDLETRSIGFPEGLPAVPGAEIRFLGSHPESLRGTLYPPAAPAARSEPPGAIPNTSHSEVYGVRFPTAMGLRNGWVVFAVTNVPTSFGVAVKNYSLVGSGFEPRDMVPVMIGSPTPPRVRLHLGGADRRVELLDFDPQSGLEVASAMNDAAWLPVPRPSEESGSRRVWKLDRILEAFSVTPSSLYFRISTLPRR